LYLLNNTLTKIDSDSDSDSKTGNDEKIYCVIDQNSKMYYMCSKMFEIF
jgi:hypothetical protein